MASAPVVRSDDVKIIGGWTSPFVMRPRIALHLKGVEYEFLEETFGQKSEALLKYNPVYKKMPVLVHHGKPVCESMIIVQYIDEVWTSKSAESSSPAIYNILPEDPYERAIQRFWAVYLDDKLWPPIMALAKGLGSEEANAESTEQVFQALKLMEEAFEKSSKGKLQAYFGGGDTIQYLDIAFGCYLVWLRAHEKLLGIKFLDEEKTPLLVGWAERFSAQEAVKEVVPETARLVEFIEKVRSILAAAPPPK